MEAHPHHLIREHRLSDDRIVTIRPIRRSDTELVRAFINGLSAETRYLRFQKWIRTPSDNLMRFLTEVDYDRHMALVCTVQRNGREVLIGDARYVIDPDDGRCEFGIVVADAWRGTGIARLLMETLMHAARERGLAHMDGIVLTCNAAMQRFARTLGFTVHAVPEDPTTVRIVKDLTTRSSRDLNVAAKHGPEVSSAAHTTT